MVSHCLKQSANLHLLCTVQGTTSKVCQTIIEIRSKSLFVTYAVVQAQEYDKDDFGPEYHNPYVYSEYDLGDYPVEE